MAENKSFECAELDLFCSEETESLGFDNGDLLEPFDDQNHQINGEKGNGRSESEPPLILLPCPSEDYIGWMVEREREHLPSDDYIVRLRSGELDLSFRREALDWFIKACAYHNFGEVCLYLAMNYFDRFLSLYALPRGRTWTMQLVTVACLSLAAKIEEVNVPCIVDLQVGEPELFFDGKTIQRMEVLVMNFLKWNMKAHTPFNYIEYFLRKMNDDQFPQGPLINRSTQIILSMIIGIDFLEFKPSEIAAAVAVYVLGKTRAVDIDKAVSNSIVEKGRVMKCLELIQDLVSNAGNAVIFSSSVPCSPSGVLDASCFCYESEERTASSHTKRRKLDEEAGGQERGGVFTFTPNNQ